ncbi:DNA alkylation repair protein [Patescibacteria group bacterium]|nr:DNA alkylation repair protein [Patescibacteria group bacterium]
MEKKANSKVHHDKRPILARFFKTGKGQYGEGDVFLGLEVPLVRSYAKKYKALKLSEVKKLLNNKIHEIRLVGLLILVAKYEGDKNREKRQKIVGFYLQNSTRINNWDLVDLSAYKILGDFLLSEAPSKAQALLKKLAESKNLWERRIAMVSTYAFIKAGRKEEVFLIAKKLIKDGEDLNHKASGWMLREFGKRVSEAELEEFLETYGKEMPRTALRYATEKFDKVKKMYYYNLNKNKK